MFFCSGFSRSQFPYTSNMHVMMRLARWRDLEIWKSRNLEIWIRTTSKLNIPKIAICVTQNVGKDWISRKTNFPAPFHSIFPWTPKSKKCVVLPYFAWVGPCCYPPLVGLLVLLDICAGAVLQCAHAMFVDKTSVDHVSLPLQVNLRDLLLQKYQFSTKGG